MSGGQLGGYVQTMTGTGGGVATPPVQAAYSDRSIANHFVSQYNGRIVRTRRVKKVTQADVRALFKAGLAVGRARQARG